MLQQLTAARWVLRGPRATWGSVPQLSPRNDHCASAQWDESSRALLRIRGDPSASLKAETKKQMAWILAKP